MLWAITGITFLATVTILVALLYAFSPEKRVLGAGCSVYWIEVSFLTRRIVTEGRGTSSSNARFCWKHVPVKSGAGEPLPTDDDSSGHPTT